jgi:exodeoxyribonuclease VII small subunit
LAGARKTPDFEQSLQELERIVARLEQGDLPLADALKSFERGVELTRQCQKALRAAQQRVEILTQRNGQETVEPFDTEGDADKDVASDERAT